MGSNGRAGCWSFSGTARHDVALRNVHAFHLAALVQALLTPTALPSTLPLHSLTIGFLRHVLDARGAAIESSMAFFSMSMGEMILLKRL